MSRLTTLINEVGVQEQGLARELKTELSMLSHRRAFGLNFERHIPETTELPGRRIRKGDKVHLLPPRGETAGNFERRLFSVTNIDRIRRRACLAPLLSSFQAPKSKTPEFASEVSHSKSIFASLDDLVVVAEFRDVIYPGLVSTGRVCRDKRKPSHIVINAENLHGLETMLFSHRGRVDLIYIDPPYNSGARDWKYNNNYVESDDHYRHSKWLAFMERRLLIAAKLLNPENSVLIVTIDEKEYLRLGLLLEQTFPTKTIQMVSTVINPKGTARTSHFSRTDEYIFFVFFGDACVPDESNGEEEHEITWRYLRRTDIDSARGTKKGGPQQFYPIYVDRKSSKIKAIGKALPPDADRQKVSSMSGCVPVFPLRVLKNGETQEMNWGLTGPSLQKCIDGGFVRVAKDASSDDSYSFYYLTTPNINKLKQGLLAKRGKKPDGTWIVTNPKGKFSRPTTAWRKPSHEAGRYGTSLLSALLPNRPFPFPKSLYAVEDVLRLFVGDKPDAVVLDFFAGSGTTAHAVMRLNNKDSGQRQSISITNNEVAAKEQKVLRAEKLRPGDLGWERWGICEFITKPRIAAAITGQTPENRKVDDVYRFFDEFPMSRGFQENADFFTLTYEAPLKCIS